MPERTGFEDKNIGQQFGNYRLVRCLAQAALPVSILGNMCSLPHNTLP